jgi:hypothetical protein
MVAQVPVEHARTQVYNIFYEMFVHAARALTDILIDAIYDFDSSTQRLLL